MTENNTQEMTKLLSVEDNEKLADIVKYVTKSTSPPFLPDVVLTLELAYDIPDGVNKAHIVIGTSIVGLEIVECR